MEDKKEFLIDKEKLLASLPKVSPKFKKEEIVEAYNKLLEKYKEGVFGGQKDFEGKEEYSREKLIKETTDFKESFSNFIGKLENKTLSEFEKLKTIKENIAKKKEELERIYDIEISLEYLGYLLRENKKTQKELAGNIDETKKKWEEEKMEKERKTKWEDEDYKYSFVFRKQKAENELDEKLEQKEKEFLSKLKDKETEAKKREESLAAREEELKNLKLEVSGFSQKIEKTKKETAEEIARKLKNEYETSLKFQEEKYKSALSLSGLEIKNLKGIIAGLEDEIRNLAKQLETSKSHLQEIVLKVIEEKGMPTKENRKEDGEERGRED